MARRVCLAVCCICCATMASPSDGIFRPIFGSACLPLDVRSLLKSELREAVTLKCASLVEARGTRVCTAECRDALLAFRGARCYNYLSQSQRLQPRTEAPLHPHASNAHTLTALQGIWYGLYPASGVELVEARYDSTRRTLVAKKLTGNDFVGAGKVTWEISAPSGSDGAACKVVSSLWQHVFTPRWDACSVEVVDADHMAVTLHMGHEGEESITFVRAVLPALLRWDDPLSPTHGFHRSMVICGVDAEDEATSALEALLEVLHHTQGTVLLDQLIMLVPFLLIGGWQIGGGGPNSALLLLAAVFVGLLIMRLTYLGLIA